MLCHTFEMSIFVSKSNLDKLCIQDTTFSHRLYNFCPDDSFGEFLINMTTGHWDGALLIGINCWCLCSDSFSDAGAFGNLQTSQQLILKDLITLDSAHLQLSGIHLPRPICSESHESSRSLPSIWCLLHSEGESQRNSNFTDVSMLSILQPSTSACPSFAGHSFAAQSLASKSIPRLTSSLRYPYSTESQMPKTATARLWTGLNMNPMPATSLTGGISTSQGFSEYISVEHSSSSGRRENRRLKLSTERICLTGRTVCSSTRLSDSLADATLIIIQQFCAELSITLQTSAAPSCTTPTTSTLRRRTLPCSTDTAGRLSYSSNGSSSISESNVSGVTVRMPYEYKFTSRSSHTALSPSSNTTSSWTGLSSRSCVCWDALCWSRITSWNFSVSGRVIWVIADSLN